ncbi:MAG: hypothetical protein ACOX9C_03310 [Kiritimatiellia bacterium]
MADQSVEVSTSSAGCFVRLYWMFLGNGLLFVLLCLLLHKNPGIPSWIDVAWFVVAASIVIARYVDIRCLDGQNGDDTKPATLEDWRRYAMIQGSCSVAAWLLVRFAFPFLGI